MAGRGEIGTEIEVVIKTRGRGDASLNHLNNLQMTTSTSTEWCYAFKENKINFDPSQYLLVKRGASADKDVYLDYTEKIAHFYSLFKRAKQKSYVVYVEKSISKRKRTRQSARTGSQVPEVPIKKTRSPGGGGHAASSSPGRRRNAANPAPPVVFSGLNNSTLHIPTGGQSGVQGRPVISLRPQTEILFRDEDTQEGNIILEGEVDESGSIKRFINQHWSNRDISVMKQEMRALIQQEKFQALVRLMPSTSGFLRTAFMDPH